MNRPLILAAASLCALIALHAPASQPFARPEVIRWGATTAELERALAAGKLCKTMTTRPIVPAFLDHVKDKQVQIDCDGFVFQGAPRWVEFVIGDDSLARDGLGHDHTRGRVADALDDRGTASRRIARRSTPRSRTTARRCASKRPKCCSTRSGWPARPSDGSSELTQSAPQVALASVAPSPRISRSGQAPSGARAR